MMAQISPLRETLNKLTMAHICRTYFFIERQLFITAALFVTTATMPEEMERIILYTYLFYLMNS